MTRSGLNISSGRINLHFWCGIISDRHPARKHGIIITDGFDCHEVRASPVNKLNGSRRNTLIRNIAKTSMRRIESKHNDLLHF